LTAQRAIVRAAVGTDGRVRGRAPGCADDAAHARGHMQLGRFLEPAVTALGAAGFEAARRAGAGVSVAEALGAGDVMSPAPEATQAPSAER
jgi:hypothetical protein